MESTKLTLLIMAGLPGAGKTTLANALSKELGWYVVDKDRYREILSVYGLSPDTVSRAAYDLSFKDAYNILSKQQVYGVVNHNNRGEYKQILFNHALSDDIVDRIVEDLSDHLPKQPTSVIFDSNALNHFVLEKAEKIATIAGNVRIKVLLCVLDRDERVRRLRERLQKKPEQPPTTNANPETIADYLHLFNHLPQNRLTIFTNTPFEQYFGIAKAFLMSEDRLTILPHAHGAINEREY